MQHPRTFAIYAYLAAGGATLGGLALLAALLGDDEGRIWWPLSRLGSAGMLKVAGVTDLRVRGVEHLEAATPSVVMANHESLFDPAVLMRPSEKPLRFVAKRELARVPIFGAALSAMGHVFVERGSDAKESGLARAAAAIRSGRTVLVFPEGTRAEGGELLPFKKGGFKLAQEARVPIVPVGIAGAGAILPKRGGYRRAGAVGVVVGEPIPTSGARAAGGLDDLVRRVRGEVERLRREASLLSAG